MKKKVTKSIVMLIIIISITTLVNINVTTDQCINYKCHSITIPLYLKVLNFFTRHYHYKQLVKEIIKNEKTDEGRVIKIFTWTYENIRKTPSGFPIIDDHVWHIIIRGYGANDQFQDVFSTLCNYAGLEANFYYLFNNDHTSNIPLSFVKIDNRWLIFDAYNGVYFINHQDKIATADEIKAGDWQIKCLIRIAEGLPNYKNYFLNLPSRINKKLSRSSIQSPFKRIIFETKKMIETK